MASSQPESPHVKRIKELYADACTDFKAHRMAAAEEKFRRLVPLMQRVYGAEHFVTLDSMQMQALALLGQKRNSEAEHIFRDVLQIQQQSPAYGVEHEDTLKSVSSLGSCLMSQGRSEEAAPMLRKVHATDVRVLGPHHPSTLMMQVTLGQCLTEGNQLEEAERLLDDACSTLVQHKEGAEANLLPVAMWRLAQCLTKAGKSSEAEPILRQAVKLTRRIMGERHEATAIIMREHGRILKALNRDAEAEIVFKIALQASQRTDGQTALPERLFSS